MRVSLPNESDGPMDTANYATELLESTMGILVKRSRGGMLMTGLGFLILLGSSWYSFSQLQGLEVQIASKKTELAAVNVQVSGAKKEAAVSASKINELKNQVGAIKTRIENTSATVSTLSVKQEVLIAIAGTQQTFQAGTSAGSKSLEQCIAVLWGSDSTQRVEAVSQILERYSDAPSLVTDLLTSAEAHMAYPNGIYNTFIILKALPRQVVLPHKARIEKIASSLQLKKKWPATQRLAGAVIKSLQ
jgi:hypothetical protein